MSKELIEKLEGLRSDIQCTVDQHNANGPTWTINGRGYYSEGFVLDKAQELTEVVDAIIELVRASALSPAPNPQ